MDPVPLVYRPGAPDRWVCAPNPAPCLALPLPTPACSTGLPAGGMFGSACLPAVDRDAAARLIVVEALVMSAVRVGVILSWCSPFCSRRSSAKPCSLSLLQQPLPGAARTGNLPISVIPQTPAWLSYDPPPPECPRSQAVWKRPCVCSNSSSWARFAAATGSRSLSRAEAEGWSPGQFLYALCAQEVDHRLSWHRHQRLLRGGSSALQKGLDWL